MAGNPDNLDFKMAGNPDNLDFKMAGNPDNLDFKMAGNPPWMVPVEKGTNESGDKEETNEGAEEKAASRSGGSSGAGGSEDTSTGEDTAALGVSSSPGNPAPAGGTDQADGSGEKEPTTVLASDALVLEPAATEEGEAEGTAVENTNEVGEYAVQKGDTIASIAASFGVTTEMITSANKGLLRVFQGKSGPVKGFNANDVIRIPAKTEQRTMDLKDARPHQMTYVVKGGESLWSIAKKHGITQQALKHANPGSLKQYKKADGQSVDGFDAGQTITIPASADPTPEAEKKPEKLPVEPKTETSHVAEVLGALETTGAGKITSQQDQLKVSGVVASEKMAATDLKLMEAYVPIFKKVGKTYGIPPALIAAIASRESRGGKLLNDQGHGKSDATGFGLMQIDVDTHQTRGDAYSEEHVTQAVQLLADNLKAVRKKHPDWTAAWQLRGAVAAYNFGVDDVQTPEGLDVGSTGNDYSSDIWARARYYARLPAFGGEGTLPETKQAPGKEEASAKIIRPGKYLTSSVGRPDEDFPEDQINRVEDVRFVQLKLLKLGLLDEDTATKEFPNRQTRILNLQPKKAWLETNSGPAKSVEEAVPGKDGGMQAERMDTGTPQVTSATLPLTILAIEKFQREVMYKGFDGRVDPNGRTISELVAASPEYVTQRMEEYPAHLARQAAEKKKKAEEAKQKAENKRQEKLQAERRQKRSEAIRNEPNTPENAQRFIQENEDMLCLADNLAPYASLNPDFVIAVFEKTGWGKGDNLAHALASHASDQELGRFDQKVLKRMRSELSGLSISHSHKANWAMAERVGKFIREDSTQDEKDTHSIPATKKLSSFNLSDSVGKGGKNKAADVLLVQRFLVAFNYLAEADQEIQKVSTRKKDDTVPETDLKRTIKAIKAYQKHGATTRTNNNAKKQYKIWEGDGNIEKKGYTMTSMSEMTKVHNEYSGTQAIEKEMTVLKEEQWRTQFRFGENFKDGEDEKEKEYVNFVKEQTGYTDPADLHLAPADKIKVVQEKYGTIKWFENQEVRKFGIKMADKARPYKPNGVCCFDAARLMLSFTGASEAGPNKKIQTFIEEAGEGSLTPQALLGIQYIDGQLAAGKAVMVGVDKGDDLNINETVTDHFVVIAGKYKDEKGWYYYYLDPGTRYADKGKNKKQNRLYIDGKKVSGKNNYTLSQVRTNEYE